MQLKLFLVTSMRHGQNRWLNRVSLSTLSDHSCTRFQALFPTQKLDPVDLDKGCEGLVDSICLRGLWESVVRGAHEWEQHKLGRGRKKRFLHLKKNSFNSIRR